MSETFDSVFLEALQVKREVLQEVFLYTSSHRHRLLDPDGSLLTFCLADTAAYAVILIYLNHTVFAYRKCVLRTPHGDAFSTAYALRSVRHGGPANRMESVFDLS